MATSYLNTGVLGQVSGESLSIGGLQSRYEDYKKQVQTNKRTISGVSEAELEAQRKRREKRLQQSVLDTQRVDVQGTVVAPGIAVDTADISPPSIPVTKGAAPKVQEAQQAANVAASQLSIVKSPAVQKAPVTAGNATLAPEKQFTDADRAFAAAYSSYSLSIGSKSKSDVRSGRERLQARLTAVQETALATGRKEVIDAVAGIEGIAGQSHISARNVGQAKASTIKASGQIRNVLDIDTLSREGLKAQPLAPTGIGKLNIKGLMGGRRTSLQKLFMR